MAAVQEVGAHLVIVEEQPPHVFQQEISVSHLGRMSGLGEDDVALAVGLGLPDFSSGVSLKNSPHCVCVSSLVSLYDMFDSVINLIHGSEQYYST